MDSLLRISKTASGKICARLRRVSGKCRPQSRTGQGIRDCRRKNRVWESSTNENPSALGNFEFPLGFPGQYKDKETGLFQNYFRDYSSAEGRYRQFDPIGLRGGINGFAYVANRPLMFTDPFGLQAKGASGTGGAGAPGAGTGGSRGGRGVYDPKSDIYTPAPPSISSWIWKKVKDFCFSGDEEGYKKCVLGCSETAVFALERCYRDHANNPSKISACEAAVIAAQELCNISCAVKYGID